ncbi:uncharacterized protein LOC121302394 [Polyodon spathula]|uniref:uncharacterized protein LOC121302394 n=1 Tax=Polyodon spathula TaxID=7913 RepID=UPI001B7E4742|nr:uncharacterized protein LOC121302394 [Polyodon spathula]
MRAAQLFTVVLLTAGSTSGNASEETPRLSLVDAGPVTEGDSFTLRCEVQGGGWTFLWVKASEGISVHDSGTQRSYTVNSTALVNSGQYWCFARRDGGLYYASNGLNVQVTVSSTTPWTSTSTIEKTTAEETDRAPVSRLNLTPTPTPSNRDRATAVPAENTDHVSSTAQSITASRAQNTMLKSAANMNPGKQTEYVFLQPWFLITALLCFVLFVVSVILVRVYQPGQRYTVHNTVRFRRRGVQLIRYMEQEEPPTGDVAM